MYYIYVYAISPLALDVFLLITGNFLQINNRRVSDLAPISISLGEASDLLADTSDSPFKSIQSE